FVGRRDQPTSVGMQRDEFVGSVVQILTEMQQALFDRALKLREDNTVSLATESEFRDYFAGDDDHADSGGFAHCYFADEQDLQPLLKETRATIRCVPLGQEASEGKCFLTGKPTTQRGVFAKAY
ncbi:MAG: proline--tRNA ligase, partial [Planctomycetota bacterium]